MAGLHRPIEKGKAVRLDGYTAGFVSTVLSIAPHRFRSHRLNQGPVKLRKQRITNKKLVTLAAYATLGVIGAGLVRAQSDAPYNEGPVWGSRWSGQSPERSDDYLKVLAKLFKATNDEMKKRGLIMDYKFYSAIPPIRTTSMSCSWSNTKIFPHLMVSGKKPIR